MKRSLFLFLAVALLLSACAPAATGTLPTQAPAPTNTPLPPAETLMNTPVPPTPTATPFPILEPVITGSATYDVRNTLTITNNGPGSISKLEVTIATMRDYAPYQSVISFVATPEENLPRIVDNYGNEFAYYEFSDIAPGGSASIELNYRVVVNELHFDATACQGDVIWDFLGYENYINTASSETHTIVDEIVAGGTDVCASSRAFYDYVINNLTYVAYNPDDVGSSGALRDGGGDCTEFADLTIALHRVGGIPARFLEGVTYDPFSNGVVTNNESKHDWLEAYLPGIGWVPMDATWGQGTLTDRETYFASMTDDHIIVTSGRNPEPLEGGHYYLWYYWWDDPTTVEDVETWTITRVVK